MSGVQVTFDLSELDRELSRLAGNAKNLTDVNAQAAEILRSMVDDKFEQEGPGWDPLSPSTIERRRGDGSAKILQDSGILAGSIAPDYTYDYAEVFTNVIYAKYHIKGTRNMPARDFFDIDMDQALTLIAFVLTSEIVS